MKTFAAIDFETANHECSSICSIGIVIVRNGKFTDEIYELVKPEPEFYSYWNTRIHGLTLEDTENAPVFSKVWEKIGPKIERLPLVAHNSSFDEACLKAAFKTYRMDYPDYEFYCTLRQSRKSFPYLKNHQLHTVSAHCGFDLINHHHALADAIACATIALYIANA